MRGAVKAVKKKPHVEIRHDPDGVLDEVIAFKPDFVHFEAMSDQSIWCAINIGTERWDLWFSSKNGKSHIGYKIEKTA